MMDKETYKKELMRMFAWVRDDDTYNMKECNNFTGKNCNEECPIRQYCFSFKFFPNKVGMTRPYDAFEVIEAVEKWSKEHPQKHKISQLEYDILKFNYYNNATSRFFCDDKFFMSLLKEGYFKGADERDVVNCYFLDCEVEDDNND